MQTTQTFSPGECLVIDKTFNEFVKNRFPLYDENKGMSFCDMFMFMGQMRLKSLKFDIIHSVDSWAHDLNGCGCFNIPKIGILFDVDSNTKVFLKKTFVDIAVSTPVLHEQAPWSLFYLQSKEQKVRLTFILYSKGIKDELDNLCRKGFLFNGLFYIDGCIRDTPIETQETKLYFLDSLREKDEKSGEGR